MIGRSTLAVSALVAAPTLFGAPPLKTEPGPAVTEHRERLFLSQLGIAGKRLYVDHCAACHGYRGDGSADGPALVRTLARMGSRTDAAFHSVVHADGDAGAHAAHPVAAVSFNDAELIARYMREMRRIEGRG